LPNKLYGQGSPPSNGFGGMGALPSVGIVNNNIG